MTFKPSGSRYYVLTAAWTYDPPGLADDLNRLRFSLLKQGHDLHRFHATEDKQVNRDAVVSALARHAGWSFAAVVIEKAKVYPDLRPPHRFYPRFAASVLRYVFRRHLQAGTSTVLVFTDTLPINKRREAVEKSIKTVCRHELQAETRFEPPSEREQPLASGGRLLCVGRLQEVGTGRHANLQSTAHPSGGAGG